MAAVIITVAASVAGTLGLLLAGLWFTGRQVLIQVAADPAAALRGAGGNAAAEAKVWEDKARTLRLTGRAAEGELCEQLAAVHREQDYLLRRLAASVPEGKR